MRLDIATVFATAVPLQLMITALFALYRRQPGHYPGAGHWAIAAGLGALGSLTYATGPSQMLRVVGTLLILGAFEVQRRGILRFLDLGVVPRDRPFTVLYAAAAAAYAYFLFAQPNTAARIAVIAVVGSAIHGRSTSYCWSLRTGPLRFEGLVACSSMGLAALTYALRGLFALATVFERDADIFSRGPGEGLALLASLTLSMFSLLTLSLLQARRQRVELEEALGQVRKLEGIVPICMFCKRIRDEHQQWLRLEKYISDRSQAAFSHGLCPDCVHKLE
jgi:hypothetical protein